MKTEYEGEIDTAHVDFMANGDETSKVNLEAPLDEDDLTMDELLDSLKNYKTAMRFQMLKIIN